jgi:hypothetical protein
VNLAELVEDYDTDKQSQHRYMEVYDLLLSHRRDDPLTIGEIGCLTGGSLRLWRDAFPKATVHGWDTRDLEVEGCTVHVGDAYTPDAVGEAPLCDLLIDDGPHTLDTMLYFCAEWSRNLNRDGGRLIVEDIWCPEWVPQLVDALPSDLRRYSMAIDRRWTDPGTYHAGGFTGYNDILLAVALP